MAIRVIQGNIAVVEADAIVISANLEPICFDGVDRAVYEAAGEKNLLSVRKMIGKIEVGQAVHTRAFSLCAKYIIHTVSPLWHGGNSGERELLGACYKNSLLLAKKLGCESIAFPLLGTKSGRIPRKESLLTAESEFQAFLGQNDLDIILVVFDEKTAAISKKMFPHIDISELSANMSPVGAGKKPVNKGVYIDLQSKKDIWNPSEHNLYAEQRYMEMYQMLKPLEEKAKKKGDTGKRNPTMKNLYLLAQMGGLLGVTAWEVGNAYATHKKYSMKKVTGMSCEDENAVNDVVLSRLIYRDMKTPRRPFERPDLYVRRALSEIISTINGEDIIRTEKNFEPCLKKALAVLARQRMNIVKRNTETDADYYNRCIYSLRQKYNAPRNNKLLLLEAYRNQSYSNTELERVIYDTHNINFQEDWDRLYLQNPGSVGKKDFEELEKNFFRLIVNYVTKRGQSISSISKEEQMDFLKVKNYMAGHREDWLYGLTPVGFQGIPYEALLSQYKEVFPVIYIEFYTLLEIIGMQEDFEVYCEGTQVGKDNNNGVKLFSFVYEIQCERFIRHQKERQISNAFRSLF